MAGFAVLLSVLPCPSFHMPTTIDSRIIREAEQTHAAEIASDTAATFLTPVDAVAHVPCVTTHVGARYAGPDAEMLGDGAADVYCSTQPILTPAECSAFRLEAQAAMKLGLSSDFTYTDVASLGEVHVADLPIARGMLRRKLSTVLPLMAERYGLAASSLRVCDAVVVRYDASQKATRQPFHRDNALVSFNIPLSAGFEYAGGGTCFEGTGEVLRMPMGRLLYHASGMRHAGHAITKGVRWVLVVFLLSTDVPQLYRRCASLAAAAQADAEDAADDGDDDDAAEARERAIAALSTALVLAPTDYQLHHDLGSFYLAEGDTSSARQAFMKAVSLYPLCPRPRGALASLLSDAGRHRAALRHYEAALAALTRNDGASSNRLIELAAAVGAAKCVLALDEQHRDSEGDAAATVAQRMEAAARWLRGALEASDIEDDDDDDEDAEEAGQLLRRLEEARASTPRRER